MPKIVALAGGVGGSKLALGLSKILPPENLCILVNTADDEFFHGLYISPDIDTMTYSLAGLINKSKGWGLEGDTFQALSVLGKLGSDTWFNLGDIDLGLHIWRTASLQSGMKLSEITTAIASKFGVKHQIIPMSDSRIQTKLHTDIGELSFQEYFVENRCEPITNEISFAGTELAVPPDRLISFFNVADAIIFCPSNPLLSIGPILAIQSIRNMIENFNGPRVAVSPIIGGNAVHGPASKMMKELGLESSNRGLAMLYEKVCDTLIIDEADAEDIDDIEALGISAIALPTIMNSESEKVALAQEILKILDEYK